MITSYNDRAQKMEGSLAYDRVRGFVQSKKSSGVIPFGRIVSLVAGSDSQVEVGGTGKPLGFALRDHSQGMDENNVGQYEDEKMVSVIDKDFVTISTVSTAGDYGDTVFYNTADGTITVADSPSATVRPIGYLAQTITAAGLCKIYVDSDKVKIPFEALAVAGVTGGSGEIVMSWDALTNQDNVLSVEAKAYEGSKVVHTASLGASSTGYTFTGLTVSTLHGLRVSVLYKDGTCSMGVFATATSGA